MLELLLKLFYGCVREGKIPREWKSACIVPPYLGKGDHLERANYRGISQLSVVQKVYGGIFIERMRISIDLAIGEDHCGFREERGCFDFCC